MACMLVLGVFTWVTPQQAFAVGTASSTDIDNLATINYQVGGVVQAPIESSEAGNDIPGAGNGTPTNFIVDNMVDLTVAELGFVQVAPAGTGYALAFTVTNTGNTTQDYVLASSAVAGDDFDMIPATLIVVVESGLNGGYQPLEDTATFIDELGDDDTATVYIVSDAPNTATDGQIARYALTATTHDGGAAGQGAQTAHNNADAWAAATLQVVFADGAGSDDGARDGAHSAREYYEVVATTLSVEKNVNIISDPLNGAANPKAIPGAIMEYTFTVTNSGANPATTVVLTDSIPANTDFVDGTETTTNGTFDYSNGAWGYSPSGSGPNNSDPNVTDISVTIANIAGGGSSETITFQVEIE